jgi:uncharacterized protein
VIRERFRDYSRQRRARWESYCLQCGLCCYEKDGQGFHVVTNLRKPCIYLNTKTHRCNVYEKRFSVCPECRRMTLRHALFVKWLPETCGYVRRFRYHETVPAEGREG